MFFISVNYRIFLKKRNEEYLTVVKCDIVKSRRGVVLWENKSLGGSV